MSEETRQKTRDIALILGVVSSILVIFLTLKKR